MADEMARSVSGIIGHLSRVSEEPPLDILTVATIRWLELVEPLLQALAEAEETVSPGANAVAR